MRKRWTMTWRAGVAMIGLAAAALLMGTLSASAQMHTEMHGAPPGGSIGMPGGVAYEVGEGYGESGLNTVVVDDGGPGMITSGGYAPPLGPACTVEVGGHGGRGVARSDDPGCGVAGAYGPIGISGGIATYP